MLKKTRQLLRVLQDQLDTCNKYLTIQNKKTHCLVVGDIKVLDAIVRDDQLFVMQIESFEHKRTKLLDEMGLSEMTINEVIERCVEDEYKDKYTEVFENLSDVLFKLKKVNDLNQKLLKQRLSVVNELLSKDHSNEAENIRFYKV